MEQIRPHVRDIDADSLSLSEIMFLLIRIKHSLRQRVERNRGIDDSLSTMHQILNILARLNGEVVPPGKQRQAAFSEIALRIRKLKPTAEEARALRNASNESMQRKGKRSRATQES